MLEEKIIRKLVYTINHLKDIKKNREKKGLPKEAMENIIKEIMKR